MKAVDYFTEWVIEEGWKLSCKFIHEIEQEFETQGRLPVALLLVSSNLADKWLKFAGRN